MSNENFVGEKKVKRGKRFSQMETDLLLSLVLSSNVNSMETNKMTPKGRSMGWESISASFNASPGVVQRTEKELRERLGNIRKDLYKLSRFQKESVQATGGGHLPPCKPPSISFELTEVVKSYALSLQVKLTGLAPVDSDMISPPDDEAISNFLEGIECPAIVLTPVPTVIDAVVTAVDAVTTAADAVATASSNDDGMRSSVPALSLPFATTQMFATQNQRRRRKRNNDGVEINNLNINSNGSTSAVSSINSNTTSAVYYKAKAQLLTDENKRRNEENERRKEENERRRQEFQFRKEWHKRCLSIKDEELSLRRQQTRFWSKLMNKATQDPINISEIANIARAMESSNPITYDNNYPSVSSFSTSQQAENPEVEEWSLEANPREVVQDEAEGAYVDYESVHSSFSSVNEEKEDPVE